MAYRLIIKLVTVFLLLLLMGCSNNKPTETKKGVSLAPVMLFKTSAEGYSFSPPPSIRSKAKFVAIDINIDDDESIHRIVDYISGHILIEDVPEGDAYMEIQILDTLHNILMHGSTTFNVNRNDRTYITDIYLNPYLPQIIQQPKAFQICDSKLRVELPYYPVFNYYRIFVYEGYSQINALFVNTDKFHSNIEHNYVFIDSTTVFPLVNTSLQISIRGVFEEDGFHLESADSELYGLLWTFGNPCSMLNPDQPVIYDIVKICTSKVELKWGPKIPMADGFYLKLEFKTFIQPIWTIVYEKPIELWKDYTWNGYEYSLIDDRPFIVDGVEYRYTIQTIIAGQYSIASTPFDFNLFDAPRVCSFK